MTPDVDYPAAHSMDTEWFAVDADGCVGVFDTDENGAVPRGHGGVGQSKLAETLSTRPDPSPMRFDPAGGTPPPAYVPEPRHLDDDEFEILAERAADCVLTIRLGAGPAASEPGRDPMLPTGAGTGVGGLEPLLPGVGNPAVRAVIELLQEEAAGRIRTATGPAGTLVMLPKGSPLLRRLHEAGLCRWCQRAWYDMSFWELWAEHWRSVSGVFGFQALDAYRPAGAASVYGRIWVPERPVRFDELTADARAGLGEPVRLPVRFAETVHVQPVEHVPCCLWGPDYLTADGSQVRAMPPGCTNDDWWSEARPP